jgi:ankyrin repeat protein
MFVDAHQTPLFMCCETGDSDLMQFLVDRGANIQALDGDRRNLSHWCAMYGHTGILPWLKEQGLDAGRSRAWA